MAAADLALVIALDGSASVTYDEFNMIVGGLSQAFRNADVAAALTAGPQGAALVAVLLWSGAGAQAVLIDWTRLGSAAEVSAFAAALDDVPRSVRPGETAIGAALLGCDALLNRAPSPVARRIIDMAGDGRSNDGPDPVPIRDRLTAAGVTINGLCVLHEEPDLLQSYLDEVVGGPGAFALTCPDYAGFELAMRRKLLQEVA